MSTFSNENVALQKVKEAVRLLSYDKRFDDVRKRLILVKLDLLRRVWGDGKKGGRGRGL